MKGLCAECGKDLTQLQNKNGKQQAPISTATVSMVHSVPELMVSSEQAEQLGREDQKRLHKNRKLVLMVDLDQTLIHTTEQHCHRKSNKGIFHFQLGRGEPMLHTRLRPYCKEFLEKIAKMYELHVFTFGSRLYAHTIAGFLDPEKKLFSHRILSRDECIDPLSKTGNLRNLFPCGDSMVCIIDDREDVWKFAPNLITVRKYVYFKGTGDINAPSGPREAQPAKKGIPANQPVEGSGISSTSGSEEQSNGFRKRSKDRKSVHEKWSNLDRNIQEPPTREKLHPAGKKEEKEHLSDKYNVKEWEAGVSVKLSSSGEVRERDNVNTADDMHNDLDFEISFGSDPDSGLPQSKTEALFSENKSLEQTKLDIDYWVTKGNEGSRVESNEDLEMNQGFLELGNGCADKKETETESQNSEQSGVTMGEESLDHIMEDEEDDEEDDTDQDDHLIYLEKVLVHIHNDYYKRYEAYLREEILEIPDIRKIVPELKSRTLAGSTIVFSGLYPTNYPMERTREYYHAKALGAKIGKNLVLSAKDPDHTTHVIAARAGTEKVRQAQSCKHLHVVNPDWLWGCLERWEKAEEHLFPLKECYTKPQRSNSPPAYVDVQESFPMPVVHPIPVQPKSLPVPEVHTYDPVTGKLIRSKPKTPCHPSYLQPHKAFTLPVHEVHSNPRSNLESQQEELEGSIQDGKKPEPSRRKRQPSMSETMPLYTLCKEDLESMDKEVDDILGEESDNESEEGKEERMEEANGQLQYSEQRSRNQQDLKTLAEDATMMSSSRLPEIIPRSRKRKLEKAKEDDDSVNSDDEKGGDLATESSKDSNEDEDGSSSEADEMAAALEAELTDFI
ncbi:RNA polymerase II subunit A C-terminal domain phosphatase isoform X2 [Hoplias malabaricus]